MHRFHSIGLALTFACGLGLAASPALAQAPTVTALSPASGPAAGGQTVSITGTGFTGSEGAFDGTVSFGANAATGATFAAGNLISAVSPAGTGVVDVTVTMLSGTSSTAGPGNDYTYIPPPAPVPTLTEWALILLAALVAVLGVKTIMGRRQEA